MSTKSDEMPGFVPLVPVLPLMNGDRLTRDEFERRWEAMPELKNAQLIEGVVHMAAAVRASQHGHPHSRLMHLLATYSIHTPGVQDNDNASIRLDRNNEPQADGLLRIVEECGGQSRITADGYIAGPPELIAEVSASSSSVDLHDKFAVYQRHGVREYLVWRVLEGALDWFVLRSGRFEPLARGADGIFRSEVFPGLWLDPAALLAGDGRQLLAVLHAGLATGARAEFRRRLESSQPR